MSSSLKHLAYATAVLGGALILNGCGGSDSSLLNPPSTSSSEKIVFVRPTGTNPSDPRGSGPIWIVDSGGKNAHPLTTSSTDSQPALANNKIVFVRGTQIWTMDADGSNQKVVPTDGDLTFRVATDPAWRNADEISFTGQETRAGLAHIYLINLKTNKVTKLTGLANNPDTSINPPGTPTTTGEREYTDTLSDEYDAEWSSDGTQMVFATDRNYRMNLGQATKKDISELYKLTFAAGSTTPTNLTRLTHHLNGGANSPTPTFNGSTGNPIFSSVGPQIFFESADIATNPRIFLIPSDGKAIVPTDWKPVSPTDGTNSAPSFWRSQQSIVYSRDGKIVSVPVGGTTGSIFVITDGVQPSFGTITTTATTPTPTPKPTTAPTAHPTTMPTAVPTTAPTPSGPPTTFTGDLYPLDDKTKVRLANGSEGTSTVRALVGDQEGSGNGAIQIIHSYNIGTLPPNTSVVSAKVDIGQVLTSQKGDPFNKLGPLYVEFANDSFSLNDGALDSSAVLATTSPQAKTTVDITSLVKKAVSAGQQQLYVRFRFQKARSNDGVTDLIETNSSAVHVTYSQPYSEPT